MANPRKDSAADGRAVGTSANPHSNNGDRVDGVNGTCTDGAGNKNLHVSSDKGEGIESEQLTLHGK